MARTYAAALAAAAIYAMCFGGGVLAQQWTNPLLPAPTDVGLKPQRLQAYERTHYWQLAEGPPVGTVVLLHGCGRVVTSFWPYDPASCPECQGLPEHVAQVKQALARGYHVLALAPNDLGSGCWSSTTNGGRADDRPDVVATVGQFQRDHGTADLPLFFIGFSSAGTMSLKTPSHLAEAAREGGATLRLDGIVTVDAAPEEGFGAFDGDGELRRGIEYPPTLYITMEKGKSRRRAEPQLEALRDNGVPAEMIVSFARNVTPTYFSDRIPTMTPQQSEAVVGALRTLGALGPDGLLLDGFWGPAGQLPSQLPWVAPQMGAIFQELGVAWGEHENLGDWITVALAWLESGGEAPLQPLVDTLTVDKLAQLTATREGEFGVAGGPAEAPATAQAPAGEPAPAGLPAPTSAA